jgi:hydroxymethylbilane synthase
VRKVDEGQVHAAILAAAGLHRLGIVQRITAYLEAPGWLPAAGQGAIAVQTRAGDSDTRRIVSAMNDRQTEIQTHAERSFLAALEGGCQVPIGALAVTDGPPILHGFISDVEGRIELRGSVPLDMNDPDRSGEALARELRRRGATEILAGLKRVDRLPSPQPE